MSYQQNILRKIEILDFLGAIITVYRIPLEKAKILPEYKDIHNILNEGVRDVILPDRDRGGNYQNYMDVFRWLKVMCIDQNLKMNLIKSRNILHHYNNSPKNLTDFQKNINSLCDDLREKCKGKGINFESENNHLKLSGSTFDGISDTALVVKNFDGLGYWLNKIKASFNENDLGDNANPQNQPIEPPPFEPNGFQITYLDPHNNWEERIAYSDRLDHLEMISYENNSPTHALDSRILNGRKVSVAMAVLHQLYILEQGQQYNIDKLDKANQFLQDNGLPQLFEQTPNSHYEIRITLRGGNVTYLPIINIEPNNN